MKIAWIGLGAMGSKMAPRLLSAGHSVVAFDVRPEALDEFVKLGGQRAESAAQAAKGADVVWLMVV